MSVTAAQHTPGPWKVHPYRDVTMGPYNQAIDVGPNLRMVARVCGEFERSTAGPEAEANARLIAAAPEMLAELKVRASDLVMLRKAIENGDPKAELLVRVADMLRETKAVIAKAEGR